MDLEFEEGEMRQSGQDVGKRERGGGGGGGETRRRACLRPEGRTV